MTNPDRIKEQIQELDALLQKMLALPILDAQEAPPDSAAVATLEQPGPNDAEPAPAPVLPDPLTATLDQATSAVARPVTPPRSAPKRLTPLLPSKPGQPSAPPQQLVAVKFPAPLPPVPAHDEDLADANGSNLDAPSRTDAIPTTVLPFPQPNIQDSVLNTQDSVPNTEDSPPASTLERDLDVASFDLSGPASFDLSAEMDGGESDGFSLEREVVKASAKPGATTSSLFHRGLLAFNAGFDWTVTWLGPLGRWLTTPAGRSFLGWAGLLLLAGALALWLGLGMGWTW